MRSVPSALCASVFVTGSLLAVSGSATAGLPAAATPVQVTRGVISTGIDASVTQLGAISGTITSVDGGEPVAEVDVLAMAAQGRVFAAAVTSARGGGSFLLTGLEPGSEYRICADARSARGGGSATGYLSRCYKSHAWAGRGSPPADADPVTVSAGVATTGIDIALASGAAIAGTVANRAGVRFAGLPVVVENRSTGQRLLGETNGAGHYRFKNLTPAAQGYAVCFRGRAGPPSPTGYLNECWKNRPWPGRQVPRRVSPVSVHLGATHTGISAVIDPAGAIAGRLTDAATGEPIFGAVVAFNSSGKAVGRAFTRTPGRYRVKGLRATRSDYVCAVGFPASRTTRYKSECYKNVPWSGRRTPPNSGLTRVGVPHGKIHHGIDFALGKRTVSAPPPDKP